MILVVLAAMLVVMFLVLGGAPGRLGRPPAGLATRRSDPSGTPLALLMLGPLAVLTLVGDPESGGTQLGAVLGILIGCSAPFAPARALVTTLLGVAGVLAAFVAALAFVRGEGSDLGVVGRAALMLLVIACFTLGALVGNRASALKGGRGLALFALVDVSTFVAGPVGADLFGLDPARFAVYFVVACVAGVALGWAASEVTLGLSAVAVAVAGLGLTGVGSGGQLSAQMMAVVVCVVVGMLATFAVSRVTGR
jgi:hypothetical protein